MASRPLVFLIHGMGTYDEKWADPFIATLDERIKANEYSRLAGKAIKDLVEFVPLVYDNYFEDTTKAWKEATAAILQQASPAEKGIFEDAIAWSDGLDPNSKAEQFAWTHLVDVLLWRAHPLIRNAIKTKIAGGIAEAIVKRLKADPASLLNTSIVSHSLGTSVAKHALEDLARGGWTGGGPGFDPAFFRFSSLHTVANVTRLLDFEGIYGAYAGVVKPGPAGDPQSYCSYFASYTHKLDPFATVRPFEPPDWSHSMLDVKSVDHLHELNVHALEHYTLHPLVHITMLRSWLGYHVISAEEELAAIGRFPKIGEKMEEEARKRLATVSGQAENALGVTPDIVDLLKAVTLFFREVAA